MGGVQAAVQFAIGSGVDLTVIFDSGQEVAERIGEFDADWTRDMVMPAKSPSKMIVGGIADAWASGLADC